MNGEDHCSPESFLCSLRFCLHWNLLKFVSSNFPLFLNGSQFGTSASPLVMEINGGNVAMGIPVGYADELWTGESST